MSNLIYLGQDGSEFVINQDTGEARISERAATRLLECPRSTLQEFRKNIGIEGEMAEIPTNKGVQGGRMFSPREFYKLAERFKPELANSMISMGANSYLLYAAGYKVNVVQPKTSLTNLELAEAAVRLFKLESNTVSLPGLTNINRAHEETDPSALPGYFTVWELLINQFDYKTTKLLSKTINKRMGQAARLTTAQHRATKKSIEVEKPDGSTKLIAVNKYPTSLLPEFEEILRQVKIEFSID